MTDKQRQNLEKIRYYKGTVADFKTFWDDAASKNTNAYNSPEYQGFNNVHPTRGAKQSPHWKEANIIESRLNENDTYSDYPTAAKKNAKQAIDWREKYGRDEVSAGTSVGWTRANQLANGEDLSADVVKRMSAFNRHRKNSSINPKFKDTPWKDRGYVAWLLWGGDEGVDWAMKKSKEIDNSN